jgi:AraC-like DNA-binding protein
MMKAQNKRSESLSTSLSASGMLDLLRTEAARHFRGVPEDRRNVQTAIPYLSFIRFMRPTEMSKGLLEPSMCLVLQGTKKVLIGKEVITYGTGNYVLSAIDMPLSGQVVEASPDAPYLGLKIDLDPKEIAALIIDMEMAVPKSPQSSAGAYVEKSDPELQDTFLRLVRLLAKPKDILALSRLIKQEILYRLLTAKSGDILYQTVVSHSHEKGINKAIYWIKENYAQPMKIEELAKAASMSTSVLHRRFKAITVMSPLQYQKQMRLLEARKLLLSGNIEAATVAFSVGYQSPSQFSREYRRFFGVSPLRDIEYLKHHGLDRDVNSV